MNHHDFGWAVKGYRNKNKVHYVLAGYTTVPNYPAPGGSRDLWLLFVDDKGNVESSQHFGTSGNDCGYAVDVLPDNQVIAAGFSSEKGNQSKFYIIKTQGYGTVKNNQR
jgi:hypothetical protein